MYLVLIFESIAGSIFEFKESIEVTEDLWGDSEISCNIGFELYAHILLIAEVEENTELISDLAIASFDPSTDSLGKLESVCPHHGKTCKKGLCDWRAKYEKQKEREHGYPKGPSNAKNYKARPRNSRCCLSDFDLLLILLS